MAAISDYNVCVSIRDDKFIPEVENVVRLIDFLDTGMYLDGPDRDDSRLVMLPAREAKELKQYIRADQTYAIPNVQKRYVNLLYSTSAQETLYRHYGELCNHVANASPRDATLVASLGRGTRKLNDIAYCPVGAGVGQNQRWLQYTIAHILKGYHGIWDRIWDDRLQPKTWQLRAVKGFTFMLTCKLNPRVPFPTLDTYLEELKAKPAFQEFLETVGGLIGNNDFELLGEHTS